jgi:hypothetical protein
MTTHAQLFIPPGFELRYKEEIPRNVLFTKLLCTVTGHARGKPHPLIKRCPRCGAAKAITT